MKKFKFLAVICTSIIVITAYLSINSYTESIKESKKNIQKNTTIAKTSEQKIYTPQKMVITMTGDTCFASQYGQKYYFDTVYRNYGATYFLKGLEKYFKNADINITNLENVFTNSNKNIGGKIYTYKAYSKDYVDVLTKNKIMYVNVVNNHMQDYLQSGFDETLRLLDSKGIKYFGTNLVDCKDPELGSVKVHKTQTFQKGNIKIGMVGYYGFYSSHPSDETIKQDIDSLKKQGCNFIIAALHGGGQETNVVNEYQQIMARKLIDLGADMIYGHHPHALQKIEAYKSKKIYYSLGNFLFIYYKSSKNPESLLLQLTLTMDKNGKITPTYKNVPLYWLGGYTQKYTPIEITDKKGMQKVNNILSGTIYR